MFIAIIRITLYQLLLVITIYIAVCTVIRTNVVVAILITIVTTTSTAITTITTITTSTTTTISR